MSVAFKKLRDEWAELRRQQALEEKARAPNYILVRLLRFETAEVKFHSPFLCDLLNPYGSHGQGAIFLRGFLAVLAKEMPEASIETDIIDVPDPGEWIVLPEHDRIDISIRSIKAGLLVFIENKIDAGWQEDQLRRYRKRLELEKHTYPKGILVLISPKSVPAETGVPPISIYTTRIMSRLGLLQLSRPSNQSV
jgi:hypothetical protein